MKKSTILIVDDQKTIHIVIKAILNEKYEIEFASNAQEAIDILREKSINLMLLDIQMPELSGLELLESLMIDSVLNKVPTIIITGAATEEREERAKQLGAAGFIEKKDLVTDDGKEEFLRMIQENLQEVDLTETDDIDYKNLSRSIIKELLEDADKNDFFYAARKLAVRLMKHFEVEYVSYWAVQGKKPNLLLSLGDSQPENFGPEELKSENAYQEISQFRKPYLTNNAASDKKGIFADVAMGKGLCSEIGVPLFKISRSALVKNKMRVPKTVPLYGFVVLKRNRVFTTKEYKIIAKLLGYSGSVLWGLFNTMFVK